MLSIRAQWPHTIEDIIKSLDGVWGVVGATGTNGNLYRLERSLSAPVTFTLTEYQGDDEAAVLSQKLFDETSREASIKEFARAIGFEV